ncbi:MAG: tyrosine-type recombinase/integrase, partial [Actinomycetota bacterium]|nr:tyrosine-type recombinase/integrase [Actinomycetota bacterium]
MTVRDGKTERSRRTIDVDPETVAILRVCRRQQLEDRLAAGPLWQESGRVFTRLDGRPLDEDVVSQQLKTVATRLGLALPKWQAMHVLRHTHATLLLAAGNPLHVVSRRLGHANEAFTAKTYAHVLPGQQADAAASFASLVDSPSDGHH